MIGITRIQLVENIETIGFLDTTTDVPFPVTFSVAEIKDITKRTGAFSKRIVIPGTKNNNNVLGSYFEVNIQAGTYNINKIQQCVVLQGGQVLLDNLYLQLIGVRKKQNTINEDDIVEYDILLKDSASMFFSRIGTKLLPELPRGPFDVYNYEFTSEEIINSFSNQWTISGTSSYRPYKFFLPYLEELNYPYEAPTKVASSYRTSELAPAIYAKFYWDLIHTAAGFSYTWEGFDDTLVGFDKLLITDNKENRSAPQEIIDFNSVIVETPTTPQVFTMSNTDTVYELTEIGQIALYHSIEIKDESSSFEALPYSSVIVGSPLWAERTGGVSPQIRFLDNDPAFNPSAPFGIDVYTSNSYYQSGQVRFELEIDWDFDIYNYQSFEIESPSRPSGGPIPEPQNRPKFQLVFRVFNVTRSFYYQNDVIIRDIFPNDKYYPPFSTTEIAGGLDILSFQLSGDEYIAENEEITFQLWVKPFPSSFNLPGPNYDLRFTERFTYNQTGVNPIITINYSKLSIIINEVPYGSEVPLYTYIPGKIKQADLIKSISSMFNLYCVPDPSNPYNLIWKRRDDFYDEGPVLNWTYKLDRSQWQEIQFLPEITSKTLTLTYKSDNDSANTAYQNTTKEIYGQQRVQFSSEWIKNDEVRELIWSPTPFNRSIWGGTSPMYNNIDGDFNLRIFYDGGLLNTVSPVYIVDTYNTTIPLYLQTVTTKYPLTIHMSGEYGGGYDINYGVCDYYFMPITTTQNNLYNLNWRRTMNQLDNQKLLTAYFHLTPLDMSSLNMASKIRIDNSYWVINKIEDFDFNVDGLTKVELVSIEDDMIINPI